MPDSTDAGARVPLGHLDSGTPATLHSRISAWAREQIASGAWPPHYRLLPEPTLAAQIGVSRGTLRRALSTLVAEGSLVQVRGKGTFVTSTAVEPAIAQKLTTLSQDFADLGTPLHTEVLLSTLVPPPTGVAAMLDLGPKNRLLRLERLRSTGEGPVALLHNFVRTDLAPGLEKVDFTTETLFGALSAHYGLTIVTGRRTFTATAATAEQAGPLGVEVGSPLLKLEQVTYVESGSPIEYSDVWIRSDRLRLTSLLTRH